MADQEPHSQRSHRLLGKKSGRPTGKNTTAGAERILAKAARGQAKRNSTKPGPISSKNP